MEQKNCATEIKLVSASILMRTALNTPNEEILFFYNFY
jgi:hypothetical protein